MDGLMDVMGPGWWKEKGVVHEEKKTLSMNDEFSTN
jgi:hypothetical protein